MKRILIPLLAVLLSACATGTGKPSSEAETTGNIVEGTRLVVRAKNLLGITVSIGDDFSKVIKKADLVDLPATDTGGGAAKAKLQTVALAVDVGMQRITVKKGSRELFDKDLFFFKGQTREVAIDR